MWQIKMFKTRKNMQKFIDKGGIQWQEVFVNNGLAIEYRKLRKI